MNDPHVVVWPIREVKGWDGQLPAAVPFFERVELRTALLTTHDTDAHAVSYLVENESAQPRLRIGSLRVLRDGGTPAALHTVWIDIDREPHEPWPAVDATVRAVNQVADALRQAFDADPVVFSTKNGLRAVFVLNKPVPCRIANAWLDRRIATASAAVAALDAGIAVDATSAQWSRCYRMPFVLRDGVPTTAVFDETATAWLTHAGELRPLEVGSLDDYQPNDRPPGARAAADMPDEPAAVPPHHWQMLKASAMGRALEAGARAGERLAEPGKRDTDMLRAVGCAARLLGYEGTPEAVFAILYRSVAAMSALDAPQAHDAPTVAKLWRVCVDVCAREAAQRDERVAENNAAASADAQSLEDYFTGAGANIDAVDESPIIVVSGSRFHVYTDPGVAGAAGVPGGYGPAVPGVALTAEMRVRQPGVPRRTTKGKLLDLRELVDRHGVVAERVIATMGTQRSTFDVESATLHVKACVARECPASYSDAIATWLRALVPDERQHERLLDWLACVPNLTRPIAALYLQGSRGSGKTLLVKGIASLWSDAPVPFETAIGRFNRTAMLACPVVHLSEGLDYLADGRRSSVSSAFRALVADGVHRVEEKHEVGGDLLGHPRVVIAANRDDALPLGGHHTRDDIAAIAQRVLHVITGEARVTWDAAEGWLHDGNGGPGLIAQHVKWLAATRDVQRGGRFLVEGVETEWHRGLVLRSGHNAQVLAAIATSALKHAGMNGTRPRGDAAVLLDPASPGVVFVNAARLHSHWRTLVDEDLPRPTRSAVARTLRELSKSGKSVSKRDAQRLVLRWWDVPIALVTRVADWHGITGFDALTSSVGTTAQGAQ